MIEGLSSSTAALNALRLQQPGLDAPAMSPTGAPPPNDGLPGSAPAGKTSFSDLVGGLVQAVDAKAKAADGEVRRLMLGESDNIHRSMIAMQESGLAFSLLVEVRNKLVESYQELMRMPV